jgi:hypothetical protein
VVQVSSELGFEQLGQLGLLPGDAELGEWVERYAGSRRITAAQADALLQSLSDIVPYDEAPAVDPRSAVVVPVALQASESVAPLYDSWAERLSPRLSSLPPNWAPEPAPFLSATATPVPEVLAPLEAALEHLPASTVTSVPPSAPPPALEPQVTAGASAPASLLGTDDDLSAEEDALLDQWSDPAPRAHEAAHSQPAAVTGTEGGEYDAPLSAAELSLLTQWSSESVAPVDAATPSAPPASLSLETADMAQPQSTGELDVDVEVEDEIELESDDLLIEELD